MIFLVGRGDLAAAMVGAFLLGGAPVDGLGEVFMPHIFMVATGLLLTQESPKLSIFTLPSMYSPSAGSCRAQQKSYYCGKYVFLLPEQSRNMNLPKSSCLEILCATSVLLKAFSGPIIT